MVGPDDGRVDHLNLCRFCPACVQGLKHELPQPGECPTPELSVNARPFAEFLRQITPLRTGSGNPENAVQHQPVIGCRPTATPSYGSDELLKERPFGVFHQQTSQDSLLVKTILNHASNDLGIQFVNRS